MEKNFSLKKDLTINNKKNDKYSFERVNLKTKYMAETLNNYKENPFYLKFYEDYEVDLSDYNFLEKKFNEIKTLFKLDCEPKIALQSSENEDLLKYIGLLKKKILK